MTSSPANSRALAAEWRLRRKIRTELAFWARHVLAREGRAPARHHLLLLDELARLSARETKRLLVLMPPGAAKSTYASVLFPPWWFARHPTGEIIAATHTEALALHFARRVRALIAEEGARLGLSLAPLEREAGDFRLSTGGRYRAVGRGAAIVGRRADLLLIDDPLAGFDEAQSAKVRERLWEWYRNDLLSRLKPGGAVALITTRWHEDDLAGRLLGDPAWRVIRLPALAEADDPLGRAPGEALWPEWEDRAALERRRLEIGEAAFAALYQQAPAARAGRGMFRTAAIVRLSAPPPLATRVRAWDLAAGRADGADPDWTVGVRMGLSGEGRFVIDDIVRVRGDALAIERLIAETAARDGREVPVLLPQDPGQAGKAQVQYLARRLAGYQVVASPESGAKWVRAGPFAAQVSAGNVAIAPGPFVAPFLDELALFPDGPKDDQVDAAVRAFTHLATAPAPARSLHIPLLGR
jgi:predicted phage terminase large subunit-like protein